MLFALDYDGTYDKSPELWDRFIDDVLRQGHKIICCTMRYEEGEGAEVIAALQHKVGRIIFTERRAKREALHALEIFPDVWIDDAPHWIFQDAC